MNRTLFTDVEAQQAKKELLIIAQESAPLSKLQKDFNRLTVQIEKLESKLASENEKIDRLIQAYSAELNPVKAEKIEALEETVLALHLLPERFSLSKKGWGLCRDIILEFLTSLFALKEVSPEMIKIFDHWSPISYEESLAMEKDQEQEMFAGFMEDIFGLDLEDEDLDLNDPATHQRLKEKIEGRFANSESKQNNRKKTKKQLEKEALKRAEEELNAKNIRSIYIALTKVLHPDLETDAKKKVEKEALMKTVTAAYEQKDLPALLKLEMQWLNTSVSDLAELPENKLKTFVKVLRQRLEDLKSEEHYLFLHPRCQSIRHIAHLKEEMAFHEIMSESTAIAIDTEILLEEKERIENAQNKKQINEILPALYEDFVEDEMDFESFLRQW